MSDFADVIRRHDDFQFEVKLVHPFHRALRKETYGVEFLFFLPENLDVNAATYTKKQFYRDMLMYLRFMAPDMTMEELADPANGRSPLARLREKIDDLKREPSPRNAVVLEYELKLAGCVLRDALGERLAELRRAPPDEAAALVDRTADAAARVAAGFRAFGPDFDHPAAGGLKAAHAFIDEYISVQIEDRFHHMIRALQDRPVAASRTAPLAEAVRREAEYRRGKGYPSLLSPEGDNELLVYRLATLKKYSASALHLSVRTEKEGQGIEQVGLALGAGVAMLFATAVAFYFQRAHGTVSATFFAALVVSYMFKDRIKALAQATFMRYRSEKIMDLSTDVVDPYSREKIGECLELVHFTAEDKIDPVALRLRKAGHVTEIEDAWRAERVLRYVKEITLIPRRLDPGSRKTALVDIARFNIRNFLLKMDEPDVTLYTLRGGRSEPVPAARAYHVNLVVKYADGEAVRYLRARLVLDQNGIKRIEPVGSESLPSQKK